MIVSLFLWLVAAGCAAFTAFVTVVCWGPSCLLDKMQDIIGEELFNRKMKPISRGE